MPVSGLVLTLEADDERREGALAALRRCASIEVGERHGQRLPIVVDTESSDEDKAVWEWLRSLPGVAFVDVVCVDSSEDAAEGDGACCAPSEGIVSGQGGGRRSS